jgi:hypothetical protein
MGGWQVFATMRNLASRAALDQARRILIAGLPPSAPTST